MFNSKLIRVSPSWAHKSCLKGTYSLTEESLAGYNFSVSWADHFRVWKDQLCLPIRAKSLSWEFLFSVTELRGKQRVAVTWYRQWREHRKANPFSAATVCVCVCVRGVDVSTLRPDKNRDWEIIVDLWWGQKLCWCLKPIKLFFFFYL